MVICLSSHRWSHGPIDDRHPFWFAKLKNGAIENCHWDRWFLHPFWFAELHNLRDNYICIYIYNSSSYGKPIIHGIINGKDWKSVQDKKCCCAKTNTLVLKRGTIPFFKWGFLRENHPATNQLDYQGVMGNEPWNMGQLWYELCCS